jgi:transposase-like protein
MKPLCEAIHCPRCGQESPAVSNQSDGVDAYRCDRCGHQWTGKSSSKTDEELPPVPAIDATGG